MSKLSDQKFVVQHVDRDLATGDKVEPEQQPVEKIAPLPVSVDMAVPNYENPGPPIKTKHVTNEYNSTIAVGLSAGEVAKGFQTMCANCKHFDPEGFQKYLKAAEARHDADALQELERAKVAMIDFGVVSGPGALQAAEQSLRSLGRCIAWSDQTGMFQATHPAATCELFVPKVYANDASRSLTKQYDEVFRLAQGKKG